MFEWNISFYLGSFHWMCHLLSAAPSLSWVAQQTENNKIKFKIWMRFQIFMISGFTRRVFRTPSLSVAQRVPQVIGDYVIGYITPKFRKFENFENIDESDLFGAPTRWISFVGAISMPCGATTLISCDSYSAYTRVIPGEGNLFVRIALCQFDVSGLLFRYALRKH